VISSNPYPIRLTLRQIRNILKVDEYMDANCFNMAVWILACHDIQLVRDIPVHYMDLNFCVSYYYHILHFFHSTNMSYYFLVDVPICTRSKAQ
jgi:hypothetical protein